MAERHQAVGGRAVEFAGRLSRLLLLACACLQPAAAAEPVTRNVVLVTIDGLRWQDVFRGADVAFVNQEHGGVSLREQQFVRTEFFAPAPEERRALLMPFLWGTVAKEGQIFGNRDAGSSMRMTNAFQISYPGYNELLAGFADDERIVGNARVPNPNVTVLEWLHGLPALHGKIACLAAWNVFPSILNVERSRLPLWLTNQRSDPATASPRLLEIERWMEDIPTKGRDEHYDGFLYHATIDTLETQTPRVLFVAFGEPDTYGHRRAYGDYLSSIRRVDRFIRQLWERLQAHPQYRGTTTLIVTVDHGRGRTPEDWANHNPQSPGSDETWLAVLGPDTPARGERRDIPEVVSSQVAATLARFLGEDFRAFEPRAAPVIDEVFGAAHLAGR